MGDLQVRLEVGVKKIGVQRTWEVCVCAGGLGNGCRRLGDGNRGAQAE